MKHTKSILMAAAAALSIASASADVIYVTGATAFRSAANNTLYSLYGSKLYAYSGSSTTDSSAIALYFTNCTLPNSQIADIAVTWTGSEGGMQSVASPAGNPTTVPFYNRAQISNEVVAGRLTGSAPYKLAQPNTTDMVAGTYTSLQKGQVGCADSFQASSRFQANKKTAGKTYKSLSMQAVGVVPYSWIASKGFATKFPDRNMSYANAFQALQDGNLTGNLFSGKLADTDVTIFTTGRNVDSGTRVIALANIRYGVTKDILQWEITASSGSVTSMRYYPEKTLNGITTPVGGSGESSGGNVASFMTNVITSETVNDDVALTGTNYLVGYVSVADISSARRTAGLVPLKYNGVEGRCYDNPTFTTLDAGYTNIINGSYPYWGYEFVSYDTTQISANGKSFADNLVTQIKTYASTSSVIAPNIKLTDMKVERSADGGTLLNK